MIGARALILVGILGGCDSVFGIETIIIEPIDPRAWSVVAAGPAHTCGIRNDRSLWCWGDNLHGETGAGTIAAEVLAPIAIGEDWRTVAAARHSCGIKQDGGLWCWGAGARGEIGDGLVIDQRVPVVIGEGVWDSVATGGSHTCAIRDDATLWCWGDNTVGQLGDGTTERRVVPVQIGPERSWLIITAGDNHTCAIDADERLACWGGNAFGQLGIDSLVDQSTPQAIETASVTWTAVAAGESHTCAIGGGFVRCWGSNRHGQLGDGEGLDRPSPLLPVGDRSDWTAIFGGGDHACAVANGALSCWGDNIRGELSNTFGAIITQPRTFGFGDVEIPWNQIALGADHSCAIDHDEQLWCLGDNGYGQLGDGLGGSRLAPTQISDASFVVAGGNRSCGQTPDGEVQCWGDNEEGQLADGSRIAKQEPTPIAGGLAIPLGGIVALGSEHGCAVPIVDPASDNAPACWGSNRYGQLGRMAVGFATTPERVPNTAANVFQSPVRAIAAAEHTCAVVFNFGMYCFGRNTGGQLGRAPDDLPHPDVVQVGTDVDWLAVTAGSEHTCGIRTNNTRLACWGSNADGRLGIGLGVNDSVIPVVLAVTPTQVWRQVVAGARHTCALTTGELLFCWGANDSGQLGDASTIAKGIPTKVGAATWDRIAPATDHTCGITTTGELWCWGDNTRGQLGDGTTQPHLEPTQVGSAKLWVDVATGNQHSCATQLDLGIKSTWCWGSALLGQLGDGAAWRSQLVRVD